MNPVYFLVLAFAIAGGGTMIGYFYSDQNWLLRQSQLQQFQMKCKYS